MPAIVLALALAISLLAPSPVCADEASEKALKLLKKKKIKVPKSGVPVDLSKLKQPQLDPWVMWWMRPYLVPGTQSAPKQRGKLKLPTKKTKVPEARPVKAPGPAAPGPKPFH